MVITPRTGRTGRSGAAQAARTWRRTTPAERQRLLPELADLMADNKEALAEAEVRATGKPRGTALRVDVGGAIDAVRYFAGAARVLEGLGAAEYAEGHTSFVRREPIGVVAQVTPWNYPLMMAAWKVGPALAAGNTLVLKPSDTTPGSTVVADVRQDDEVVQQEIFGPVVTVQPFADEDEAVALANGVEYALASSLWTRDTGRATRLSAALDFGAVCVNCHQVIIPEMPHGGFKHSGTGKDLARYGLDAYTRVKHVLISHT
ncbi:aldehyde dehydrogenase family protein [Microbispora rosea]|uniref:aldehyde dehydrogenase family protein n=1 Tax=Microbispora rosea TaxID=58117 RepID=UPI00342396DB